MNIVKNISDLFSIMQIIAGESMFMIMRQSKAIGTVNVMPMHRHSITKF